MSREDSFAILGLGPGASRAQVDQAYRRLIKLHHPDQAGGDVGRAAELNRAYSELRRAFPPPPQTHQRNPLQPSRQLSGQRRSVGGLAWLAVIVALFGGLVFGAALLGTESGSIEQFPEPAALAGPNSSKNGDPQWRLDEPLSAAMIESAVNDAMRLEAGSDPRLAGEFSRHCLARLASSPSIPLFDSCAAFDEAVAVLSSGNPAFQSGPFSPSAVTARQLGAARLLSADSIEAESRLQQVRSRVHMQILPGIPDLVSGSDVRSVGRRSP